MINNSLWVERYRPTSISEYVFKNDTQKNQVSQWIENKDISHVIFWGPGGIGKTTLALVLINEIGIYPSDVLKINASRENSVDDMRNKISNFAATMPFGDLKIVLLDEFDFASVNAQAALRGIMEQYSISCRFLITANYPNKIIPAIHSRCQEFKIDKLDLDEFTERTAKILLSENIDFELDTLDSFVRGSYPDLRKCINSLQANSIGGKLVIAEESAGSIDYKIEAINLFKAGKIREGRQLICSQMRNEDAEELFRFFYDNLDFWGSTDEQKDQAIMAIRKGLVNVPLVADQEINISAALCELAQIQQQ
jgi:replication factor C small subunit